MMKQTTFAKKETHKADWWIIDGSEQIVGRLAVKLATILMGKHKATYTPHCDTGDFIVVTNCEKVVLTGNKMRDKVFRYHSGHIGGLKEVLMSDMLENHPDRILRNAVRRMLPKTKMGRQMLKKLKIYAGTEHPHGAQEPKELKFDARRK